MARLDAKTYPGHWDTCKYNCDGGTFMDCIAKESADLDAIPADKLFASPVADGQALYYVKSLKPLVLQHIPFGDGYQIHGAMMRGLRVADIEQYQESQAFWHRVAEEQRNK